MKDLFGEEIPLPPPKKRLAEQEHEALIKNFGAVPNERCKNCKFLYVRKFSGTYFKCNQATNTQAPSTDWRANWQACGKFEKEDEGEHT